MSDRPDFTSGASYEQTLASDLPRTQIVQYAGASGDYNPAHTDELFATGVLGYPSVFAHGMLTMGMVGQHLSELLGVANLRYFGGRFTAQVWPGDALKSVVAVKERREDDDGTTTVDVAISVVNQNEDTVFSGAATAVVS